MSLSRAFLLAVAGALTLACGTPAPAPTTSSGAPGGFPAAGSPTPYVASFGEVEITVDPGRFDEIAAFGFDAPPGAYSEEPGLTVAQVLVLFHGPHIFTSKRFVLLPPLGDVDAGAVALPDGRLAVGTREPGAATIALLNPADGLVKRFESLLGGAETPCAMLADGRLLFASRLPDGDNAIGALDVMTAVATEIWRFRPPANAAPCPAVAIDGTAAAYVDADDEVWTVALPGGELAAVQLDGPLAAPPSFAPDGRMLLLVEAAAGPTVLAVEPGARAGVVLGSAGEQAFGVNLTQDGREILVVRERNGVLELTKAPLGGVPERLVVFKERPAGDPASATSSWSPDGKLLLVTVRTRAGAYSYAVETNKGTVATLASLPLDSPPPVWLPDGTGLAW